jgi:hypothetical protein
MCNIFLFLTVLVPVLLRDLGHLLREHYLFLHVKNLPDLKHLGCIQNFQLQVRL